MYEKQGMLIIAALCGICHLQMTFAPGNAEVDDLTKEQKEYIEYGEENGYNKNYKCRIRPKWYYVSSTWDADAFLIRQAHLYPRMILNKKNAVESNHKQLLSTASYCFLSVSMIGLSFVR